MAELREKAHAYLANDAQLAVLVDPEGRTVEVYRPGQAPEVARNPSSVALDPELPGFLMDLTFVDFR